MLFELALKPVLAARINGICSDFQVPGRAAGYRGDRRERCSRSTILELAVRDAAGERLRDVVIVFDIYAGQNIETGSKSVALGLILQETSRTLTEADVDEIMHAVIDRLSRDFNATIRE